MTMTLPYRILALLFLFAAAAFSVGPWQTMRAISAAAAANDSKVWPSLVDDGNMKAYADIMVRGLLNMQMYADLDRNSLEAMKTNWQSMQHLADTLQQLTSPQGLSYFLCGELLADATQKPAKNEACWGLHGDIHWESLQRARITFSNPETHWQSSLVLNRVGLFTWKAVEIDLPAKEIMAHFMDSVGLKAKPEMVKLEKNQT